MQQAFSSLIAEKKKSRERPHTHPRPTKISFVLMSFTPSALGAFGPSRHATSVIDLKRFNTE